MSHTDEDVDNIPTDSELGEEEYEEEEEEEVEEDVPSVYDSATFISGPRFSDECSLPEDILEFDFSYGYECRKHFNLTAPDPDTLIFTAGNLIVFFDVPKKEVTFRRSALGGGIGHIKANPAPEFNHVAIAENGETPLIIIYEWPTLDINCVLKGGAERLYSHLDFSPDGLLLVSQSGEPDYLITIFNWPQRKILLRTKSYVNDVYRVKFSPDVPGQLTTCGISHIKFWKMATTFTGLKLQGDIGRFGKTEFSDIIGVLPMPDEKVVSGCSWGNILVWDAGLIKLEVFRTLRRKCHDAPIVQIYYDEGELLTVSMDGHVKIWWYEKIDQADPPDEDRVIQIEPLYDFYTPGISLMCIRKRYPDKSDSHFFAQDANGGIWIIDLNTQVGAEESERLHQTHAGKVMGLRTCPWGPFFVSLGEGGKMFVYDYVERKILHFHAFPAGGMCLLWISTMIAEHGDEVVLGFNDGTLRLCIVNIDVDNKAASVIVTQAIKPHDKPITQISINRSNTILVSGGEDSTIFVFQMLRQQTVNLVPIGYIRVPNIVTCLTWHFQNDDEILVGCLHGEIVQVKVPHQPQNYTGVSFLLKDLERKDNKFKTYKAQIRRDIKIREIQARKDAKVEKKREKMMQLKKDNPHLEIDEDVFLADSESEEELEPLFIPEIPNRIIWMQSTSEDNIWLSIGGYDAGYIYEYKIDQKDDAPYFFKMVHDADDTEISSYIYNHDKKYLIFAMQTGEIRVHKLEDGDHKDLTDYWILAMHNNHNGFVPNLSFSYTENYLFSCGHDGNIFAFKFHPENDEFIPESLIPHRTLREKLPEGIEDEPQFAKLSLEQASLKREQDRIDRLANKNKEILRDKLRKLHTRFFRVLKRNQHLKPSQIIPQVDLELDPRITEHINMKFLDELNLVKRKLAFQVQKSEVQMTKLKTHLIDCMICFPIEVKGLNSDCRVKMLRQRKLDPRHEDMRNLIEEKIKEAEAKSRTIERAPVVIKAPVAKKHKERGLEYFLISLSPSVIETRLGPKLTRLLQKYRDRKLKWEKRNNEWETFMAKKPVSGVNHPDDEVALKNAQQSIGDYKLKSAKNYRVAKEERVSTVNKYKQLLLAREKQFNTRHEFNNKVWDLRDEKVQLRKDLQKMKEHIEEIHLEIPEDAKKEIPPIEEENEELEFPERKFEIKVKLQIEEDEYYDYHERQEEEKIYLSSEIFYDFDRFQRDVLPERSNNNSSASQKDYGDICQLQLNELFKISENTKRDTPWEHEIRQRRLQRKIYEQTAIIAKMNKKIEHFNKRVVNLSNERYEVEVNAKVMDIFVLTVHQELVIIKEFESLEEELQEKVNSKILEVLDMGDFILQLSNEIQDHENEIVKCNDDLKVIQNQFISTVSDNKFYDFLKKVFKKKYRPPKIRTDDDSSSESSSSSSSSSDEEDAKSIDSRDFGIIKQDLNVCPKGCDPAIYEYTVNARSNRHQVEIKIKGEMNTISQLKKDLEMEYKKVKLVEKSKEKCEEELEKFQSEKQRRLNEVRATVFLKLNQLQHLTPEDKRSDIMDTIVFSSPRLSKLYQRVDELLIETEKQQSKHNANLKHLTRMNTDCNFMKQKIKNIKRKIQDEMMIKFGKPVDINEIEEGMIKRTFGKDDISDLEEVLLKKLVHDLRLSLMDIKGMYVPELNYWRDAIIKTQKDLATTLRNNTSRRDLLTVLGKEKVSVTEELLLQIRKKMHLSGLEQFKKKFTDELAKLEGIAEDQKQQIDDLRDEIKMLKTKGLPPKIIKKEVADEEIGEIEMMIEDITEDEVDSQRKPFATEIIIPLHEQAKLAATHLIEELMSYLNLQLNKKSSLDFIKGTLNSVMRRLSVTELVEDLIKNLPIQVDDDQRNLIELTAERLLCVQEPDPSDEDISRFSKEILEDIVDDVLLKKVGPTSMIITLVRRLVEQLPIEFLLKKDSLELLAWKLINANLRIALDKKEIEKQLVEDEAKEVLNGIIEIVFGTGLDIIYYIEDY